MVMALKTELTDFDFKYIYHMDFANEIASMEMKVEYIHFEPHYGYRWIKDPSDSLLTKIRLYL